MNCGHLFNGIGGFPLAAHWMGWNNYMHCEIDPFCNRVMSHHFQQSVQHEDIRTTDFSIYRGKVDLLTGGFPCQPYSTAGKRKGKADDRHLWPEMLRAIREVQPGWVVGENVRGLTNWNGGLVFDEVQAEMESEGYEVLPFLLPAAGVEAPHGRDRIWFIAHSSRFLGNGRKNFESAEGEYNGQDGKWKETTDQPEGLLTAGTAPDTYSGGLGRDNRSRSPGCPQEETEGKEQREKWNEVQRERNGSIVRGTSTEGNVANANSERLEGRFQSGGGGLYEASGSLPGSEPDGTHAKTDWGQFPTVSPVCNRNDGLSLGLARISVPGKRGRRLLSPVESYGRWRKESIKALGNAIVPQVAYQIFKAIEQYQHAD